MLKVDTYGAVLVSLLQTSNTSRTLLQSLSIANPEHAIVSWVLAVKMYKI